MLGKAHLYINFSCIHRSQRGSQQHNILHTEAKEQLIILRIFEKVCLGQLFQSYTHTKKKRPEKAPKKLVTILDYATTVKTSDESCVGQNLVRFV